MGSNQLRRLVLDDVSDATYRMYQIERISSRPILKWTDQKGA